MRWIPIAVLVLGAVSLAACARPRRRQLHEMTLEELLEVQVVPAAR